MYLVKDSLIWIIWQRENGGKQIQRLSMVKTKDKEPPGKLNIERHQVIAFALYTHDAGVLKLTAQLSYPLLPEESREVRLEVKKATQRPGKKSLR